jgi:hypothetical protein
MPGETTLPYANLLVRRNGSPAVCARLGYRLGRVRTWGSTAGHPEDAVDFGLRAYLRNDTFGMVLLARRLVLSEQVRHMLDRLVQQVDEFFALPKGVRKGSDLPPFLVPAYALYVDLATEIEVNYGFACSDAFRIMFEVMFTQKFFDATDDAGPLKGGRLRKFLYSDDVHKWVLAFLRNLHGFCEDQPTPPVDPDELRYFADGFGNRSLSAAKILRIGELIHGPWPNALQEYFSPTDGADLIDLGGQLSIGELVSKCFMLGELCGRYEPTSRLSADEADAARENLKRIRALLTRLHLPFDPALISARLRLTDDDPQGQLELPDEVSTRAEYGYTVCRRLEEAVECLYGGVLKSVLEVALHLGAISQFVTFESDDAEELMDSGEPAFDAEMRPALASYLEGIADALDSRWIARDLAERMKSSLKIWNDPYASAQEILGVCQFLKDSLGDEIIDQATSTLSRSPASGDSTPSALYDNDLSSIATAVKTRFSQNGSAHH